MKKITTLLKSLKLVVDTVTDGNISINATSSNTKTVDVSKEGYKFLGVVGYYIMQKSGSNGRVNLYALDLNLENGTVWRGLMNLHTNEVTVDLRLYCLYQKVGG